MSTRAANQFATGCSVNSPDYWDERFQNDWETAHGCEQTRLFAWYFLRTVRLPVTEGTFLDAGCAMGDALPEVHKRYPRLELSGCDVSPVAVERAREKHGELATFLHCGFEGIEGHYDIIYCSNSLEHFADYLAISRRLLAHCDWLYVLAPYKETLPMPQVADPRDAEHVVSFDRHSLDGLVRARAARRIRTWVRRTEGAWGWSKPSLWRRTVAQLRRGPADLDASLRQVFFEIRSC